MKVWEIETEFGYVLFQGACHVEQTEQTTHDYPGHWETIWDHKPEIVEMWDFDGNPVRDIPVNKENALIQLALENPDRFTI